MPSRPNRRTVKIALVAYRDNGDLLQLVPLGSLAKPLPVAELLAAVRDRVDGAAVAQVVRFPNQEHVDGSDR